MAIAFPLTLPTAPGFTVARWRPRAAVATGESPFTSEEQVQVHPGELWILTLELPPLRGANAAIWEATLLALNGQEGSFLLPPPRYEAARGSLAGDPVVDGAGQSGRTLQSRGWTADAAGVLLRGDFIGLGSGLTARFHMVTQDVNADATGDAAIEIWPRLRYSPADGAAIVVSGIAGLFKLAGNEMPWDYAGNLTQGLQLPCREII